MAVHPFFVHRRRRRPLALQRFVAGGWGSVAPMIRTIEAASALALGAALVCSGAAQAQVTAGVPGLPGGSQRVSGSVQGTVSYNDNVAGGDAAVAAVRGVTPQDTIYDLGANVNLQLPSGRQTLFLTAAGDLQRHARNSVLDANNYNATGGALGRFGACSASAILNYSHLQTQSQDLTVAVENNVATQEGVNGSLTCSRGHLFAGLQAGYVKMTNSATSAGFVGSETGSVSASAGYQSNSLGRIALSGQYSKTNYIDQPVLSIGQVDEFEQYSATLSYSRRLGMRLSGSASISLQSLKTPATLLASESTFNNLGSNVSFNYRLSSRASIFLGYELSNQASPTVNANYVRVEALRLGANYTLNQRISMHVTGSKSQVDYRGGQPVFSQVSHSDDDQISAGLNMKIGRKISLTLDGTHVDRRADLSAFSYSSNQVTLGLSEAF